MRKRYHQAKTAADVIIVKIIELKRSQLREIPLAPVTKIVQG